jgi:large subunit ribosomal protein L19
MDRESRMKAKKLTKETIGELGMYDRSFPEFKVGDTVAVSLRIKEGDKERVQAFEGDVIAKHKKGASSTFTVRKISDGGISVERILPVYSPLIADIKIVKHGDVRRAKLYYVRDRVGKAARIKEKIVKAADKKK